LNVFIALLNQQLPILQFILFLATVVGAVLVVRNTKKTGIVQIQSETIVAMQQQIDALKEQNAKQQEKIDHQEFKLQAMQEALKDEGILITIDGERVTIKDVREPNTTRHIIKKKPTTLNVVKKPTEE
jgi:hypothetical protein